MNEPDIDAILRGGSSRKRWVILSAVAVVVVIAAVAAFLLTRSDEADIVAVPEEAEAVMGQLSTQVELSGSALAERSATLSFEATGVVASIAVAKGNEVETGDVLGTLDDAEGQRQVETAEVQLRLAQLRLDSLLADPDASAVASAEQAIASAKSQVIAAEQELALLSEPASAADLASAEQAVATALGQLSSAEQDLALLSEPPSAAEVASAEEAVAAALGQLSTAQEELAGLAEPPGTADLASAEQAVANALSLLLNEEEALAGLMDGPSEAEVAGMRSAVTQAQVHLAETTTIAEELLEALTESYDAFCDRYSGLSASDEVIRDVCREELPLSEGLITALRDSFEDRSSTYETFGTSLIDASVAFVAADADMESAESGLATAEESLSDLLQSFAEDVVYQVEQSVEAARASHAAAVARLADLREVASAEDVFQGQQAVEAARASHAAAVARLEDLGAEPGEEDLYQAEQALEAAKANHEAAVARLEDLRAAADDADFEQARTSLEGAQASLAGAEAQYEELVAGATENAIEQQRQDVRLAELALEEARDALTGLSVFAPFDGVVEAIDLQPGDRASAGQAAFTLNTSNRMLISLTVTEEELLELEAGQTGVASFDAIDGIEYPVRVESVGRVPNSEQGVVTYEVEARILTGAALAQAAGQAPAGSLRPGAGGFAGGPGGGAAGGALAGFELPEGVTIQQVRQAIVSGEPLPEGVELPEEAQQLLQSFRDRAGGGAATGGQGGNAAEAGTPARRPLPAPGMSASVTILTEIREEAVLVPLSAVRQLDGDWFVSVPSAVVGEGEPGHERVFVEVGESDGTSVEIRSGVDAGAIVLIGADSAGIAFTATQRQPSALPGFGGFGRPPGGGGR